MRFIRIIAFAIIGLFLVVSVRDFLESVTCNDGKNYRQLHKKRSPNIFPQKTDFFLLPQESKNLVITRDPNSLISQILLKT